MKNIEKAHKILRDFISETVREEFNGPDTNLRKKISESDGTMLETLEEEVENGNCRALLPFAISTCYGVGSKPD